MLNKLKRLYKTTIGHAAEDDFVEKPASKIFLCNCCIAVVKNVRWTCTECEGYDYCDDCHSNIDNGVKCEHENVGDIHKHNKHLFVQTEAEILIEAQSKLSNAESLQYCFEKYRNFLCLGSNEIPNQKRFEKFVKNSILTNDNDDDNNNNNNDTNNLPIGGYWLTFDRVEKFSLSIAAGLEALQQNGAIVFFVEPRVEFCMFDFAMVLRNNKDLMIVPVSCTATKETLLAILKKSSPSCVVCSAVTRDTLNETLKSYESKPPPTIIDLDLKKKKGSSISFEELCEKGEAIDFKVPQSTDDGAGTRICIFSSGSTGEPKGVVINADAWRLSKSVRPHLSMPHVGIMWQALGHSSARRCLYADILGGGRSYSCKKVSELRDIIRQVRPTMFSSTPAFWNSLHQEFEQKVEKIFENEKFGTESQISTNDYDDEKNLSKQKIKSRIYKELYKDLGGRLRYIVTGGAPTAKSVKQFLSGMQLMLHEGFGTSETGAVLAENGEPLPHVQVKLEDCVDLNYFVKDNVGQLCVKSTTLFQEYLGDAERTARAFTDDGYYRTGDVARYDPATKRYSIVDRVANFVKLAQGVFVALDALDTVFVQAPAVAQVCVCADGLQDRVVALVVPAHEDVTEQLVLDELRTLARANELKAWEIPGAVALLSEPFSVANGCLTASRKLARHAIMRRHADTLKRLFSKSDKQKSLAMSHMLSLLGVNNADSNNNTDDTDKLNTLNDDVSFADLGGNSLMAVKCSQLLASDFGLDISVADLISKRSLKDILNNAQIKLSSIKDSLDVDVLANQVEEYVLKYDVAKFEKIEKEKRNFFITGANGFLGCHLIESALKAVPMGKVFAMIRAEDVVAARNRLSCALDQFQLKLDMNRVEVVCGDLSLPLFGMPQAKFETLSQVLGDTALFVQNGALVNASLGASALRTVNVGGTAELLKLAVNRKIILVSTIGAAQSKDILERSGYSKTKREAEQIVEKTSKRRIGSCIARPGAIGPNKNGAGNVNDFRVLLIEQMLRQCAAPLQSAGAARLRFVSVNYVADTVIARVLSDDASRDIVWLPMVSETSMLWSHVIEIVADYCNEHSNSSTKFNVDITFDAFRQGIANDAFRSIVGTRFVDSTPPDKQTAVTDSFPLTDSLLRLTLSFLDKHHSIFKPED